MDRTRQRVVERVARAAETSGDAGALYTRVIAELARGLDFDGACWHISDPLSAIPVRDGGVGHPPGDFARSIEFESHRDDVLRFDALARRPRPVGTIALETGGRPLESPRYGLSEREREIVRHAIRGETNGEIATRLHLSPWTVQDRLEMAFEKTGARSRGALAAPAVTDTRAGRPRP